MPQIFKPSANSHARTSIILAVVILGALGGALFELIADSTYATRQGDAREQPIPFSHAHHVASMGIDCRYCHTSVENSDYAVVPPTKTCMNCHSQIWINSPTLEPVRESYRTNESIKWTKVHDLPDYVYFNHSIHVKKGVGCETCHGRVDKMPLMYQNASLEMRWCLDCHRNPEKYVRPREFITKMGYEPAEPQEVIGKRLVQEYHIQKLETCWTCHR
ncbi:MAG: cytochrome c family protein [Acidobacteriota bacterium]|nr:cytochrome c family protein [Acidobacteriota bacterium]